ncbi:MAG: NADH-quinone oxidoreductase subunit A [Anaerolineae bacterium]|nr:NADH-quinone oxidoreductase subunit A [Anaerolineae bacterium]
MTLELFAPAGVLVVLAVIVTFIVLMISRVFGPFEPSFRKNAPYESGMKPIGPANRRLPVKFYLVAVLFIVFDVEVIFFLPWSVAMRDMGVYGLLVMGFFTLILIVGFLYEWKKGALEWE